MQFITLAFLLFLGAACLIYFVLPLSCRSFWLLVCSYLFYLYEPANVDFVMLLLSATAVTYIAGLAIERLSKRSHKRVFLCAGLAVCLGSLLFYKYFAFFSGLICNILQMLGITIKAPGFSLALPLGISYFTFMAVSYLVDVYKGKQKAERNFFYYALFVSFFPCIVTGPIERAHNMIPQFKAPVRFNYNRVAGGLFRILWGFFKKLVIADAIGKGVSVIFANYENYTGPMLLLASLLFSYELYCDFSACSDIAVGAAGIFGITIMENFDRPLAADTFTGLWRRWHISLTSWLRDYIYIPLGGNRRGKARMYINQLVVFAASGLWHGASLCYCVWGLMNGVYLCVGKATAPLRTRMDKYNPLYYFKPVRFFIKNIITYLLFTSCIVFFAAASYGGGITTAIGMYQGMFAGWGAFFSSQLAMSAQLSLAGFTVNSAWIVAIAIFLVELLEALHSKINEGIRRVAFFVRWPLYYLLILGILFFGEFGKNSFFYQTL